MPVISALGKLRQEANHEFGASLEQIMSFRPVCYSMRDFLRKRRKKVLCREKNALSQVKDKLVLTLNYYCMCSVDSYLVTSVQAYVHKIQDSSDPKLRSNAIKTEITGLLRITAVFIAVHPSLPWH